MFLQILPSKLIVLSPTYPCALRFFTCTPLRNPSPSFESRIPTVNRIDDLQRGFERENRSQGVPHFIIEIWQQGRTSREEDGLSCQLAESKEAYPHHPPPFFLVEAVQDPSADLS